MSVDTHTVQMSGHQVKQDKVRSRTEGGGGSLLPGSLVTPGCHKFWALHEFIQDESAHTHRAAFPPGSLNTKPYLAQEFFELESSSVWEKVSDKPVHTLLPGHPFVAAGRGKLGQVDLDLML